MAFQQTPGRFNANDFKAMLSSSKSEPASLEKSKIIKSAPKRQEPKKKKESKGVSNVFNKSNSEAMPPPRSRFANTPYRDRVAERNSGENRDYAEDERLLEKVGLTPMGRLASTPSMGAGSGSGSKFLMTPSGKVVNMEEIDKMGIKAKAGTFANPEDSGPDLTEDDMDNRQQLIDEEIEKSKLLGGDEEHTHLVKGLDFVLLAKERAKLESQRREEEESKADTLSKIKQSVSKALDQVKSTPAPKPAPSADRVEFKSTLGRSVFGMLSETRGVRSAPRLKGASFVFDLSADSISEIPRTTFTSSLLGSRGPVMCRSSAPEGLVQNISYIIDQRLAGAYGTEKMRRQRAKDAKKREEIIKKEKEKLQADETLGLHLVGDVKKAAPVQVVAEEDADSGGIFSDEGGMSDIESSSDSSDSDSSSSSSRPGPVGTVQEKTVGNLFTKSDEQAPPQDEAWDAMEDLQSEVEKQTAQLTVQPAKLQRLNNAPSASAYGECFPDTFGGPDLEGFAAGLDEVDEVDITREEVDKLRLDPKEQKREEKRKKQVQENKIKLELQRMEVERKKRGPPDGEGSSKKPKLE